MLLLLNRPGELGYKMLAPTCAPLECLSPTIQVSSEHCELLAHWRYSSGVRCMPQLVMCLKTMIALFTKSHPFEKQKRSNEAFV